MTTYGERNCDCCGNVYTAKCANQRYCCVECQHKANRILKSDPNESYAKEFVRKYADGWEYVGEYTGSEGSMIIRHKACGSTVKRSCVAIRHNKIRCNECYKAECERERSRRDEAKKYRKIHSKAFKYQMTEIKECAVCGALFFSTRREKYCSDQCAKKVANRHSTDKKEKKRKAARTSQSNDITIPKLYARDNGVCWICGGKCNIEADGNDNYYPSVDHIVPVSLGGKDQWDNVRLAHRICNSLRGNKPVGIAPVGANA